MKIHRKGKEIPPFKLEKAGINTRHLQDESVTAAKMATGVLFSLTLENTEVFNGTLTADDTWEDLDLSGTVGAKVTLVLLGIVNTTDSCYFAVRTNGDTDDYFSEHATPAGVASCTLDQNHFYLLIAVTDASGVIEIVSADASDTHVIDVVAYLN